MSSQSFSRPGAVDLSSLSTPTSGAAGARSAAGGGGFAIDVTEETFQAEVLTRSLTVPVVIDFWSPRSDASAQLSPVLQKLAAEQQGRFVLARVDVDAQQALAASAQVQNIPTVLAVLRGQAVPLFEGAPAEEQVRGVIDQLLQAAVANGVTGRAEPFPGAEGDVSEEPAEEPGDPRFDAAYDAISAGDFDAATAAYQAVLAESPADAEAKAGLAQVELLRRTRGVDEAAARSAAEAAPDDIDAQFAVADLDLVTGRVDEAFDRLIATVRRASGDDRERVRARVVELFEIVGVADPRVTKARAALASALF